MLNEQKIITMTKLAVYDKREWETDNKTNGYFRHDYLYRKNMGIRFSVGLGGVILLLVYWSRVFFVDGMEVLVAEFNAQAYESGLFLVALLMVYSLIGTIQGTREYYLMQKRLDRYFSLLRQLERIEARARRTEGDPADPATDAPADTTADTDDDEPPNRESRLVYTRQDRAQKASEERAHKARETRARQAREIRAMQARQERESRRKNQKPER
jgi:hypothetical protein